MESPHVVAVVLNRCREGDTIACLRSLGASIYPALTVLLVDNGSPDGSGERLHDAFPALPYLQTGANLGYAGGNNRGISWALAHSADYVMVLNEDTEMEPNAVTLLVDAAAADPQTGGVAPKILYHENRSLVWYAGGELSMTKGLGIHRLLGHRDPDPFERGVQPVSFLCGCCWLFPADVLRTMGGFAEDFFIYAEDAEMSLRLTRAGYSLLYQPAARVYHRIAVRPQPPTPFQIALRDRNRRRMVRGAFGLAERLRFSAWFYPTRIGRLVQYVAGGDWSRARAIVRGMTER